MIKADLSQLDHRYRAKRTGLSPAEYARSIERYKRPATLGTWLAYALTVGLLLAAFVMGSFA